MKVGDIVRHRFDGEVLIVKSISGGLVASCYEINKPKMVNIKGDDVYQVRVSLCKNLEYQTIQTTMF